MENREKIKEVIMAIKDSKTSYVIDLVKELYSLSDEFQRVVDIKECHEYTKKEDVFVNANDELVLHISYAFNHVERVVYVLKKDSECAMRFYAHNTCNIIRSDDANVCFVKRTCYGYGTWGTTLYDNNLKEISHSEKRESLGCCCD